MGHGGRGHAIIVLLLTWQPLLDPSRDCSPRGHVLQRWLLEEICKRKLLSHRPVVLENRLTYERRCVNSAVCGVGGRGEGGRETEAQVGAGRETRNAQGPLPSSEMGAQGPHRTQPHCFLGAMWTGCSHRWQKGVVIVP